jgi:hypothetical protein
MNLIKKQLILNYFAGWFCFRKECWLFILKRNILIQKNLILFPSFLQTGGLKRLLKQTQTLGKSKQTLLRENQTFVYWN